MDKTFLKPPNNLNVSSFTSPFLDIKMLLQFFTEPT